MKYLKLYESFDSSSIRNTIKYLSKSLSKEQVTSFMYSFKKIMEEFDIPLSRLSNKSIDYLRTSKAVNIDNKERVENEHGIYCIKYWFSIEKGFLGETGTGNLKTPYTKLVRDFSLTNEKFLERQFDFIQNNIGLETGTLTPILDYTKLKTGDDVVVVFGGENRNDNDGLVQGKVYLTEPDEEGDYKIYIYNNRMSGSRPDGEPNFADDYTKCRSIGTIKSIDSSHFRLHSYTYDKKKLRYKRAVPIPKEEYKPNPGDINKPIDYGRYGRTSLNDWTMGNQRLIKEIIDDSNFAIIVYLDDLLKGDSRKDISRSKNDARQGATALMSDNDIRLINLERFAVKLMDKYGINKDISDFSKLGNYTNSVLCGKFILFTFLSGDTLAGFQNINDYLYTMIEEEDKEFHFTRVLRYFKESRKKNLLLTTQFEKNLQVVNRLGNKKTIRIVNKFVELGKKTNSLIEKYDIKTINDLIMLQHKLRTLENFMDDSRYRTSYKYNDIISSFKTSSISSLETYIDYCNRYCDKEDYATSMRKLEVIEKFIDNLLK